MTIVNLELEDECVRKILIAELFDQFNMANDSHSVNLNDIEYDRKIAKALARVLAYNCNQTELKEMAIDPDLLFKEQRV